MKKKMSLFLLLIAVTMGTAFAQTYKDEAGYKYWTSLTDQTYRTLRIQTPKSYYISELGFVDLVKASVAGVQGLLK